MRRSFLLLAVSLVVASGVVAACKQKTSAANDEDADGGADGTSSSGMPAGDDDDNADQGKPAEQSNGIPCDVEAVLENRCYSCHGGGTPQAPSLQKYEDLTAMSTRDPKKTRGQLAGELMGTKEMPKAPGVATDDEIKTVADWVLAGMKRSDEACILAPEGDAATSADSGTTTDGGGGADGGLCTSGTHWTGGNDGSELMHPGGACIACHSTTQGGPAMSFAGTVFPSLHEPDDCNGVKNPVTVVVTDKRKRTIQMTTNAAGNFFILTNKAGPLRPPFTVEVRETGKATRKMNRTINGGDCNGCHTVNGTGIPAGTQAPPGRILEPVAQ